MKNLKIVNRVILHHTCFPPDTPLQMIRAYHIEKRGWDDIGYHWVMLRAAGLWFPQAGRDENMMGSHCLGHNQDSIGVAINDNCEINRPDPDFFEPTIDLLADICSRHNLPASAIELHCQHSDTACPGRYLIEMHSLIVEAVAERQPLEGRP